MLQPHTHQRPLETINAVRRPLVAAVAAKPQETALQTLPSSEGVFLKCKQMDKHF